MDTTELGAVESTNIHVAEDLLPLVGELVPGVRHTNFLLTIIHTD